jgi:peptidyl-prolyl cis-trans isomerase B (cyclophilin B)
MRRALAGRVAAAALASGLTAGLTSGLTAVLTAGLTFALTLGSWVELAAQQTPAAPAPAGQSTAGRARGAQPGTTGTTAGRARGAGRGRGTAAAAATRKPLSPGAGPVVRFETVKGVFEMETYPNEAPKHVEQILKLVKSNFYNGLRVHRQVPGFVVQFGDPLTRDMTKKDRWGTGGSNYAIGVSESNPKRTHVLGAVAAAHPGDPRQADSQIYVTLAPVHRLDGGYTVLGGVILGMDVVQKLAVGDIIRRATIVDTAPAK